MRPWLRWAFYGGAALGWAGLAWDAVAAWRAQTPIDGLMALAVVVLATAAMLTSLSWAIGKTDD